VQVGCVPRQDADDELAEREDPVAGHMAGHVAFKSTHIHDPLGQQMRALEHAGLVALEQVTDCELERDDRDDERLSDEDLCEDVDETFDEDWEERELDKRLELKRELLLDTAHTELPAPPPPEFDAGAWLWPTGAQMSWVIESMASGSLGNEDPNES
jgi:hypothetical protein